MKKWISGSFRTGSSGPLGGISGGRKFRPTGRISGPSANWTKSFWDPSLEGSRNFSPGSSPRKFLVVRKFRPSGRKFRPVEIFGGNFRGEVPGPLQRGIPRRLSRFHARAGTSAHRPEFPPPRNSTQRAGTSGPESTRNPFLQDSLFRL